MSAADEILELAKKTAGDAWAGLGPEERRYAASVASDFARLHARAIAGEDVGEELAQVRAQLAVICDLGKRALASALQQFAEKAAAIGIRVAIAAALGV